MDASDGSIAGDNDVVVVRQIAHGLHRIEVVATWQLGLDCDIARYLFDERLSIHKADINVDGRFVLMAFVVSPDAGTQKECYKASLDWDNVRTGIVELATTGSRLADMLALDIDPLPQVYSIKVGWGGNVPDKLAQLMVVLHDCGLLVLHSDCVASSTRSGQQRRMSNSCGVDPHSFVGTFCVCDRSAALPGIRRREEVACRVRAACGGTTNIEFFGAGEAGELLLQLNAAAINPPSLCKQTQLGTSLWTATCPESSFFALPGGQVQYIESSQGLELAEDDDRVILTVDDSLGHGCSCVTLHCDDRRALLYDVLRTIHGFNIMVHQSMLRVDGQTGRVEMQIFLKDARSAKRLSGHNALRPLLHRLRKAVLLPITMSVTLCGQGARASIDVHVFALPDAAGRGRPRVSLAIAAAVREAGMAVESSFVGILDDQAARGHVPGHQIGALASTLSFSMLQKNVSAQQLTSLGMNSSELPCHVCCMDSAASAAAKAGGHAQEGKQPGLCPEAPKSLLLTSLPPNYNSGDESMGGQTCRSHLSVREPPLRAGAQSDLPTAFLSDDDSDDDLWHPGTGCPCPYDAQQSHIQGFMWPAPYGARMPCPGPRLSMPELLDAPTPAIGAASAARCVEMHWFRVVPNGKQGPVEEQALHLRVSLQAELLDAGCCQSLHDTDTDA